MGFTAGQLATASLIGQIGGGVSSAVGGYYGASVQKMNLQGQAAMAESNARIAELGAQSALQQGNYEASRLGLQAGKLKSRQKATLAANGVDIGTGSAAELQASTDVLADMDKNTLLANAVRNAWGQRLQGMNYQNQALGLRASASGISPVSTTAGSLLGTATSVASSWYQFDKAGVWNKGAPVVDMSARQDLWSPVSWG